MTVGVRRKDAVHGHLHGLFGVPDPAPVQLGAPSPVRGALLARCCTAVRTGTDAGLLPDCRRYSSRHA